MLAYFQEAFKLYKNNFLRVLLIGITVLLPIQLIYTILINYVAMPFQYFNLPLWTSIFQSIFMLMSVFVMFIPLISMVAQDTRTSSVKTGKLYGDTIRYAFFAYLISIPVSILITTGLLVLIVPGIILLVLLIGIPFVTVIEDERPKSVIKKSISFGKENFLSICGILLSFAAFDVVGTYLVTFAASVLNGQMAFANWLMIILNIFVLPLFVFTIAKAYLNWNGETDTIQEKAYLRQLEQYN
ncbi:hypothetical protein [Bacillus dakarensis]|uniref:hypothetical protein n=1 Tax=Robertmurraya dakarensis TaxID=1926278 RepID=UPI000980A378|nr:hypothetical protein [Bacillus dakarensis]